MVYTYADIAKMIDHALLVPTMTTAELEAGIDLAVAYEVASVCVMPYYLKQCTSRLADTSVKASTTIGFPHGVSEASVKLAEAKQSIADGCEELFSISRGEASVDALCHRLALIKASHAEEVLFVELGHRAHHEDVHAEGARDVG